MRAPTVPLALLLRCAPLAIVSCAGDPGDEGESASSTEATSTTAAMSSSTEAMTSTTEATSTTSTTEATSTTTAETTGETLDPPGSAGCGLAPEQPVGGVVVELDVGPAGDGLRTFTLALPEGYDPSAPHRLILGYPGTNWTGEMIRPYLDLEATPGDAIPEIFVYPDPLWRDFDGWGNLGGWVLGPHAYPADGDQDLVFTAAILDHVAERYCVDEDRIFVTGHSWGGDMAQVVACFLGDRITAAAPAAANRPYWFETGPDQFVKCPGGAAVWTFFGVADDHFTDQDYPGHYGDECRDFWLDQRACAGVDASDDLGLGGAGECVEYQGCDQPTRYCLYGPATQHQIPAYFGDAVMTWFRSF
ncbi:MAG: hypothetical protein R3B09_34425 [Nannocystaceae bacterium]